MNYQKDDSGPDDGGVEKYLAALPVPPMSAGLAARCRMLVAANDAAASSRPRNARSGRLILLGGSLAVSAAAAMLIIQFRPTTEVVAPVQPTGGEAVKDSVPEQSAETVTAAVPIAGVPAAGKNAVVPAPIAQKPFTVRVLPLQNGAQDALSRSAVETFYMSLLDRLRAVPGLTLLTPQSAGTADDAPAAYEISVKGYGSVSAGKWNVELKAQAWSVGADRRVLATVPFSVQGGAGEFCTGEQASSTGRPCSDPASMASTQVDMMRNVLFPADPAATSRVRAQLLDSSLDPAARLAALTELRYPRLIIPDDAAAAAGTPARLAPPTLDDAALRGALGLASTAADPAARISTWRALRGMHHPALVEALVKAMNQDDSERVVLQVTTMLAQDFLAEPLAASALKAATQDHPSQLVRMISQRAVTGGAAGDALWREYVIDTLKDTSLPVGQRLDPFIYMVGSDRTPDARNVGAFLDDTALRALAMVFPSVWSSGRDAERLARPLVNALQLAKGPAVLDLYAEILRHAIDPMTRWVAVRVLVRDYRNDPRTRTALELVAATDPNPELRKLAAESLQQGSGPAPQ
ncbi:MAG TPA: HEAT repeat domain-containing protein [Steroidobacteraceae bacterium]|nr:HEAT repeat domain-containing protein [Steroidobacteraceae bacterium]